MYYKAASQTMDNGNQVRKIEGTNYSDFYSKDAPSNKTTRTRFEEKQAEKSRTRVAVTSNNTHIKDNTKDAVSTGVSRPKSTTRPA